MIEVRVSEGGGKKNKRHKRKIPNSISFGLRSWKDLWSYRFVIVSLRSSGLRKGIIEAKSLTGDHQRTVPMCR